MIASKVLVVVIMVLLLNKKYKNRDYSDTEVSKSSGRTVEGALTCNDIRFLTRLGYKVLWNCNEKHSNQKQQEQQCSSNEK